MNNLNSILIEGNLVKDPVIRTTPKSTYVCNFTIATNRYHRVAGEAGFEREVSFFDIETWGRLAESCYQIGKKGRGVRVVGRLRQDRWQEDGKNRARIIVVAEHVEFKPYAYDKSTGEHTEEELSDPAVTTDLGLETKIVDECFEFSI
jgi:single-strand DNA-binding protein